jgi:hypothetical protein
MSLRACFWDVWTDATLNSSKLLDTDGRLDGSFGIRLLWLGICTESSLNFLKHIYETKTEINGILNKMPKSHKSDFVKQNVANRKLTEEDPPT